VRITAPVMSELVRDHTRRSIGGIMASRTLAVPAWTAAGTKRSVRQAIRGVARL